MNNKNNFFTPKELALCGLFGAAGLMLPVIFHALHLGHIFMPMYLPLVALGFFVAPLPAALTAFIVPILSGAVTGMPPFYPPVAIMMSIELAIMSAFIALIYKFKNTINEWLVLVPVLILGRVLSVLMVYIFSLIIDLPAKYVAGVSFISGWPGLILILVVVPPIARIAKKQRLGIFNHLQR